MAEEIRNQSVGQNLAVRLGFVVAGSLVALYMPNASYAEPGFSSCDLTLRLVAPQAAKPEAGAAAKLQMSSFVQDADEQLKSLPFSDYQPVAMQEQQVPQGATGRFQLSGGKFPDYEVEVHPKSLEKNRVKLVVDWRELGGREVISTQMCVPNGENVVLGNDRSPAGPVMVLIKPQCR